jgi:hypothetical protein
MADPLTLTAVTAVVLTEGVKFLYGQASDVLKRWRDHRERAAEAAKAATAPPPPVSEAIPVQAPAGVAGTLAPVVIHYDRVEPIEGELKALLSQLSGYKDEIEPIRPSDADLVARVATLRRLLEGVYGQTITFKGEQRPTSGTPLVLTTLDLKEVAAGGEATGIRVTGTVSSGTLEADVKADVVGGKLTGIELGNVGGPPGDG